MARPPIMDMDLQTEAQRIMTQHGITYDLATFRMRKIGSHFTWDTHYQFRFFTNPNRLNGSCAVIEMHQCFAPKFSGTTETFPGVTDAEWLTLFKWHVRSLLQGHGRRMALATLIASQRAVVPFLREAGFEKVSDGFNPGTRHKVTVWALSI